MEQHVRSNEAFTLIELLVALVIIFISIIGLMQMSAVVMRNNVKNEIRNKAITVLNNHIYNLTSANFDSIQPKQGTTYLNSYVRNIRIRNFNEQFTITDNITKNSAGNEKRIHSTISWIYNGKKFYYSIDTVTVKR